MASRRSSRAAGDVAPHFRILQDIARIAIGENAGLPGASKDAGSEDLGWRV